MFNLRMEENKMDNESWASLGKFVGKSAMVLAGAGALGGIYYWGRVNGHEIGTLEQKAVHDKLVETGNGLDKWNRNWRNEMDKSPYHVREELSADRQLQVVVWADEKMNTGSVRLSDGHVVAQYGNFKVDLTAQGITSYQKNDAQPWTLMVPAAPSAASSAPVESKRTLF